MGDRKYRIGVATSDNIVVNQHFGRAAHFLIIDVDQDGQSSRVETRTVTPICQGGNHEDAALQKNAEIFSDCQYLLVSRIGPRAADCLEEKGIMAFEIPGMIDDSVRELLAYVEVQKLLNGA